MDHVHVASLMVILQEVEPDVYVLVLEWSTGFFAMQMEDILSTKMGTLPKLNP